MCAGSQKWQSTVLGCASHLAHVHLILCSLGVLEFFQSICQPEGYKNPSLLLPYRVTMILWTFWNINFFTNVSHSTRDIHGHCAKHKHKYLTGFLGIPMRNSDEKKKKKWSPIHPWRWAPVNSVTSEAVLEFSGNPGKCREICLNRKREVTYHPSNKEWNMSSSFSYFRRKSCVDSKLIGNGETITKATCHLRCEMGWSRLLFHSFLLPFTPL